MGTNKERDMIRLSLPAAVASILGNKAHEDYRDIGQNMLAKDLYKLMGLTGSPMLYNYMSGKTQKIDPERAMVLLTKFDLLVDKWLTPEELREEATNREVSLQIAREPIRGIIEEIVEIETIKGEYEMRRGLRKLIARYY